MATHAEVEALRDRVDAQYEALYGMQTRVLTEVQALRADGNTQFLHLNGRIDRLMDEAR